MYLAICVLLSFQSPTSSCSEDLCRIIVKTTLSFICKTPPGWYFVIQWILSSSASYCLLCISCIFSAKQLSVYEHVDCVFCSDQHLESKSSTVIKKTSKGPSVIKWLVMLITYSVMAKVRRRINKCPFVWTELWMMQVVIASYSNSACFP